MNRLKSQKGVTMISLVITIIVLVILASIVAETSMSSIKNSRFERMKNELEIIQANVNLWHEKYIDQTSDEIFIGKAIPTNEKDKLQKQLKDMKGNVKNTKGEEIDFSDDIDRYRYVGKNEFENLQILGIENDYIIDVKKRVAILIGGYEYDDKTYYIIDQIKEITKAGDDIQETIKIESLSLNNPEIQVKVGEVASIEAIITPEKATETVKWTISSEGVVNIESINGDNLNVINLKAIGTGKITLTAISKRGTAYVSCDVVVKEGNEPQLSTGMIPVKYNVESQKWVICSKDDLDWYNYSSQDKKWANVMLCDGKYNTATQVGTEVDEKDLGSMFVWIPRFAYKITEGYHTAQNGKISIVFLEGTSDKYHYVLKDDFSDRYITKEETATRSRSDVLNETSKMYTDYIVHPCFTNGYGNGYNNGEWKSEIAGIWVSKFQAGIYTTEKDTKKIISNATSANGLYYPIFKGNKFSYNYVTASQCYDLSLAISSANNPYGLTTEANSHLIKNSEWGAVAYLSMSEYGYSGGIASVSTKKVDNKFSYNGSKTDIRNKGVYGVTGYTETSYKWNNVNNLFDKGIGTQSSTTGNIYGVYDMGGITGEYTSSYVKGGILTNGTSFATNISSHLATAYPTNNNKVYDFNNNYDAYNKIYGDAVYEVSYRQSIGTAITGWFGNILEYDDNLAESFFARGGVSSKNIFGLCTISDENGSGLPNLSFRSVLVVEE